MVSKIKKLGLFALIATTSELSAATISWIAINAQAVPMSFTSMLVLAGLFLVVGVFLLQKMQHQGVRLFMMAALVAGTFGLATIAKAAAYPVLEITDGSDAVLTILDDAITQVHNSHTDAIKITSITPSVGCNVVQVATPVCQLNTPLAKDQSCYITIECDAEEEPGDGDYEDGDYEGEA